MSLSSVTVAEYIFLGNIHYNIHYNFYTIMFAKKSGGALAPQPPPPYLHPCIISPLLHNPLNCTFKGILPFESGPLVSLLLSLRITAVQTGLVAATVCEFVHGGPARNAHVSCLRRCDERTRVITCVNKSLVQALESCPFSEVTPCTCCSANLSTFYRENSKSAGLVNAYMDS